MLQTWCPRRSAREASDTLIEQKYKTVARYFIVFAFWLPFPIGGQQSLSDDHPDDSKKGAVVEKPKSVEREKTQPHKQEKKPKTQRKSSRQKPSKPAAVQDVHQEASPSLAPQPALDAPHPALLDAPIPPPPAVVQDVFDPSRPDHVTLVRNVLAISGSRRPEKSNPDGAGGDTDCPPPLGRQQQFQQLFASLSSCCQTKLGR